MVIQGGAVQSDRLKSNEVVSLLLQDDGEGGWRNRSMAFVKFPHPVRCLSSQTPWTAAMQPLRQLHWILSRLMRTRTTHV